MDVFWQTAFALFRGIFISEIDQLIAYKSSDHEFHKSALELFPSQLYSLTFVLQASLPPDT